ncbi:MAG TPA: hypothetical protein VFL27_10310 [Candidatus Dormibacteraeota bacterium]|nr:hypothetical protein [Candidatus Dormibacteraeota bacterium]
MISLSTTTGWFDWEHGELWLSSDGLVRRRRGWPATVAGGGLDLVRMAGAAIPEVHQELSPSDIATIRQNRGLWLPAEQIAAGRLREGIITGRAQLSLKNGGTVKLLWARSRLTFASLRDALAAWVGEGLTFD